MNIVYKLLFFACLNLVVNASCASSLLCEKKVSEDIYSPVVLGGSVVRFRKSETSVDSGGTIFPIIIVEQKCDSEIETQFAELPYLGDPGKVDSAFLADSDFDGKAELFVIHRVTLYSDTGISYGSDYFTTLVYKKSDSKGYERNDRISAYFGEGGDILSSSTSNKLIYYYPYKSEESVKSRLASAQYKSWFEQGRNTTRLLRKTYLYDQANVADKTSKYLIAGDEVIVVDQKSGWLEVVFRNNIKGDIKGWIQCGDTLECARR